MTSTTGLDQSPNLATTGPAHAEPIGETIARNINAQLERLGWEYDDLAAASGLSRGEVVAHRGDASDLSMYDLALIAGALGVRVSTLVKEAQR